MREIRLPTYRVSIAAGLLDRVGDLVTDVAPAHRYALVTDSTSPCHVLGDGVDLHQRQPSIAVHERLSA